MLAQVQVILEPERPRQVQLFSSQFPFFKRDFAHTSSLPSEDLASAIPTRTSPFSNHRRYPETQAAPLSNPLSPVTQIAGTTSFVLRSDEEVERFNRAIPFHLQFAEADPFKGGRPLELTGGYDTQSQQWAFDGDAAPGWSWIGGYDTVVCSRDVVVYTSSKEWCSAGGRTDVMWDDSLEDVIQTDNDMP